MGADEGSAAGAGTALMAAAKPKPMPDMPPMTDSTGRPFRRWRMPVAVLEGVRTGDRRLIASQALTWRDLPQPLMATTTTSDGHDGAELVGRIDAADRVDASKMIDSRTGQPYGKGAYAITLSGVFTNDEEAGRIAQLIADRFLRGVSVDMGDVERIYELVDAEGEPTADEEAAVDMLETVTAGRIGPVTILPFPAFEAAYIELLDDEGRVGPAMQPGRPTASEAKAGLNLHDGEHTLRACGPCAEGQSLVAGGGPQYPPAEWFEDPKLGPKDGALTVLDSGRIFGRFGDWETCHTGYAGQCVRLPHSAIGYAAFHRGMTKTAEGTLVNTGLLTMDTGHADTYASRTATLRHYEHTGCQAADIRVGEDPYGPWVAGAIRPDLSETQIRTLRASAMSGDWREWGGNLELMALLLVNTPGFPVFRELVAGGIPRSLVASAGPALWPQATASQEVHSLLAYLPELRRMRAERGREARAAIRRARADIARTRITR